MSEKDGGPAFPGVDGQDGFGHTTRVLHSDGMATYVTHNQGMTLWDYYARGAMQTLIDRADPRDAKSDIAKLAGDLANAMLAERKKRGIGQ